jgi:hypothetical protein
MPVATQQEENARQESDVVPTECSLITRDRFQSHREKAYCQFQNSVAARR